MYDGNTFEHDGHKFRVTFPHDDTHGAPWDEEDGRGPVSDWKRHRFGMGSKPPKAPGELILIWDNGSYRTYDFREACRIARRDGWNAEPYDVPGETPRQRAAKAARADYERLRRWCNDQWHYVGVVVELLDDEGDPIGESASLWGVESDADEYLEETARELAGEVLYNLEHALKRA